MRIYAVAVYLFLYIPIGIIVLFSFNAGRHAAFGQVVARQRAVLGQRLRDLRLEMKKASGDRPQRREAERPFARRVAEAALGDFREAGSWEELAP